MILRMHHRLIEDMRRDLQRRHRFAGERVGFLWARPPPREGSPVQIAAEYIPLADDDYIEDRYVGARFSGAAIRGALQRTLTTSNACFHVHLHEHHGEPGFSTTDERSMMEFVPAFTHLVPAALHGALLLSADDVICVGWEPGIKRFVPLEVTVVGFPVRLPWRTRHE